jgi:broad specificity phosphatase PhoE
MQGFYGYITSNNKLTCLCNLALSRTGHEIPSGWVFDNGTVIKMGSSGIQMIHPKKVSIPGRYVGPEKFNETFKGVSLSIPPEICIYLMRHGHGDHNDPSATLEEAHDAKITQTGTQQAIDASQAILADTDVQAAAKDVPFSLYCSPLLRTIQTAKHLWNQLSPVQRPKGAKVCIEALENCRPYGGIHYWEESHPLRKIACDPFLSLEELSVLAPGKSPAELARMRIENLPKNNPLDDWENCIKRIDDFELDWSDYLEKLQRMKDERKSFGEIASERLLLDLVLANARAHL